MGCWRPIYKARLSDTSPERRVCRSPAMSSCHYQCHYSFNQL